MSETLSERIAAVALDCFERLPRKCRPRTLPDGRTEWTPLSAIVASRGPDLTCISLATGTKCLPRSLVPLCHGTVIHDSHAEILALRGLNRWLLDEVLLIARDAGSSSGHLVEEKVEPIMGLGGSSSPFLFLVNDQISFHMFTTEAPCGDASMELLMASKGEEGSVPWTPKPPQQTTDDHRSDQNHRRISSSSSLPGRGYFSELGIVRRKPARGDSEPSRSKSCTDKLTMKQHLSLLSFPADILIGPTPASFLKSIVLPADQANEVGYSRAFGRGRRLSHSVQLTIDILPQSSRPFAYARSQLTTNSSKVSNVSVLWVRGHGHSNNSTSLPAITEVLINGVRQGFKQFDTRSAKESAVCRKQLWHVGRQVLDSFKPEATGSSVIDGLSFPLAEKLSKAEAALASPTYADAKATPLRAHRTLAKQTMAKQLGGWPPNEGDESWGLS